MKRKSQHVAKNLLYVRSHQNLFSFLSFFFAKKLLHSFFILVMWVFARTCRSRLSYHQDLLGKYIHLQYNAFAIYDKLKTIPQRPSHDNVPQKHTANWQGYTSRRNPISTKLLLNTLRHGCPHPLYIYHVCSKTLPKWNTSEELLSMHLQHTDR